jgi:hypothetical protein
VGATNTASTTVVTTSKGRIGGTSGQPSSDDHAGEARLLATDMLSATSSSPLYLVPTSVCATFTDLFRRRAVEEEYDALITNNTWDLVPRHVGSNIVTDKWIFKHKFNSDGTLEWYKTR